MIQPLILGKVTFPQNMIQGPLAGISCAPFRRLVWKYSQPAFTCTEMLSCKTLIHQRHTSAKRYLTKAPDEGPLSFQLSGNDPAELSEATKIATAHGADLIDLNCGCPVNKIRKKGAGSRLLQNANTLYALIRAMKNNTHVPVSVKIRVDGDSNEACNNDVAKAITEGGADCVIVHGRHWTEHYETPCRYDQIQFFVNALSIPVIGNGDVQCLKSLQRMLATGCKGIMIARAGVGQPWLIQKLLTEANDQHFIPPTLEERGEIFLEHIVHLMDLLQNEKFALLQARKFAKYYARETLWKMDFATAIHHCLTLKELEKTIQHFFI